MAITQDNRSIWLESPFGQNALLVQRFECREALNEAFSCTLFMISERGDLDPDAILGQEVAVSLPLPGDRGRRHFHGQVTEFTQTGYQRRRHEYCATVRPWLWFLTRTSDCRIFQNRTIPEIFEEVVKGYGFADYELRLSAGDHGSWEYCVQYRETDFDFINRLLEKAGIYYWFRHEAGRHIMVLADDSSTAAESVDGYASVPFVPPSESAQRRRDHLSSWVVTRSIVPGAVATTDFDFKEPRKSLQANATVAPSHARGDFEILEYPAEPATLDAASSERVAQLRLEEQQVAHLRARGSGDAAGLSAGCRFTLSDHPRRDQNIEYLVMSARHSFVCDTHDAGSGGSGEAYSVEVECIDAHTLYRPPRVTPKPVVHGAQTAMVVGRQGEEIDTDQYGRVKVQFPWDRYAQGDENSSCWVRVAQVWAGKGWGSIHIPRIGQEVLVSFLEGDPDRPIITGRVYNGDSMPPYELPAKATQSGIKSRSTKGGSTETFNEIRFEDNKGQEELYVHAEKDLQAVVENDSTKEIGHDLAVSVGNVEKRVVGKDRSTEIGESESLQVGTDQKTTVGKRYTLEAGDEVVIKTGASSLVMKKDGTIELKGVKLKIEGGQSIDLKAGSQIKVNSTQIKVDGVQISMKGTQTAIEGLKLDLKGTMLALQGALIKIN